MVHASPRGSPAVVGVAEHGGAHTRSSAENHHHALQSYHLAPAPIASTATIATAAAAAPTVSSVNAAASMPLRHRLAVLVRMRRDAPRVQLPPSASCPFPVLCVQNIELVLIQQSIL